MSGVISGQCPMGCGRTLFIGNGGHVTCSYIRCPNPGVVSQLLNAEVEHVVTFGVDDFAIVHPLRERLSDMTLCSLHRWLSGLAGVPIKPGRYRATFDEWSGQCVFTPLPPTPAVTPEGVLTERGIWIEPSGAKP